MERKLTLSETNKKFGGVCGGIAEFLQIDPTIVRLVAIGSVFLHGLGLIAYLAAWIVMPKKQFAQAPIHSDF